MSGLATFFLFMLILKIAVLSRLSRNSKNKLRMRVPLLSNHQKPLFLRYNIITSKYEQNRRNIPNGQNRQLEYADDVIILETKRVPIIDGLY